MKPKFEEIRNKRIKALNANTMQEYGECIKEESIVRERTMVEIKKTAAMHIQYAKVNFDAVF